MTKLLEVHNARRPLDHLTITLTFDLIFIGGRGISMDNLCAKFGDFSFSRLGFILWTDRQTNTQTEVDNHYTHVTTVGVISTCCDGPSKALVRRLN